MLIKSKLKPTIETFKPHTFVNIINIKYNALDIFMEMLYAAFLSLLII